MPSYMTSDDIVNSVKRRAFIPEAQNTFSQQDFLDFANEEMYLGLVPAVLQFHQEFLVYPIEIPILANVTKYAIPERALGSRIRDILYKSTDGNLREMARIEPENRVFFDRTSFDINACYFYLENNNIVLVPNVTGNPTGSLLVTYYQRPNALVKSEDIGIITAIDTGTGVITIENMPDKFDLANTYDLIQTRASHKTLAIDLSASAINTTTETITLSPGDIPSGLSVGDMIAFAGETFIPQLPDDLHVVLAQRVACRCLEAMGDVQNLQFANQKLAEMEVKMATLIDSRVEGAPQKANNVRSPLRQARMFSRRRKS